MAEYLSDDWFEKMDQAARTHAVATNSAGADNESVSENPPPVALREIITGGPFGDVSYVMVIENGSISITRDDDAPADVTFSQAYATAASLHRGEMTTQEAFFAGKVRVAGHVNTLLDNAEVLHGISDAFTGVRAATTYNAG